MSLSGGKKLPQQTFLDDCDKTCLSDAKSDFNF